MLVLEISLCFRYKRPKMYRKFQKIGVKKYAKNITNKELGRH